MLRLFSVATRSQLQAQGAESVCCWWCRAASTSLARRPSVVSPFARSAAAHIEKTQRAESVNALDLQPAVEQAAAPQERRQPVRTLGLPGAAWHHLWLCQSKTHSFAGE